MGELVAIVALLAFGLGMLALWLWSRSSRSPEERGERLQHKVGFDVPRGYWLFVSVEGDALRLYRKDIGERVIPRAAIVRASLQDGRHLSVARVAAVGVAGFAWRPKDHFLLIDYVADGIEAQGILSGEARALDRIHAALLKGRQAADSNPGFQPPRNGGFGQV